MKTLVSILIFIYWLCFEVLFEILSSLCIHQVTSDSAYLKMCSCKFKCKWKIKVGQWVINASLVAITYPQPMYMGTGWATRAPVTSSLVPYIMEPLTLSFTAHIKIFKNSHNSCTPDVWFKCSSSDASSACLFLTHHTCSAKRSENYLQMVIWTSYQSFWLHLLNMPQTWQNQPIFLQCALSVLATWGCVGEKVGTYSHFCVQYAVKCYLKYSIWRDFSSHFSFKLLSIQKFSNWKVKNNNRAIPHLLVLKWSHLCQSWHLLRGVKHAATVGGLCNWSDLMEGGWRRIMGGGV